MLDICIELYLEQESKPYKEKKANNKCFRQILTELSLVCLPDYLSLLANLLTRSEGDRAFYYRILLEASSTCVWASAQTGTGKHQIYITEFEVNPKNSTNTVHQ